MIPPVLANLTLDGLERVAHEAVHPRSLVNMVRYADDFVVTARTPEQLTDRIIPAVSAFLAERGLELSATKTRITTIDAGFDFLGATVRKYDGKLLMTPSRASVKTFLDGIRGLIKARGSDSLRELVRLLNPRIRGWANYFRGLVSSRVFSYVDNAIYDSMVRWMRRRHPRKGLAWLRRRYFRSDGSRHWIIAAPQRKRDGSMAHSDLFRASSLPIRRHVKVRAEATALDPAYEQYFQQRRKARRRFPVAGNVLPWDQTSRSPRHR